MQAFENEYTGTCIEILCFYLHRNIIITPRKQIKGSGTIRTKTSSSWDDRVGRFAQNFERDCSHKFTGTIRTKLKLLGQVTIFKVFNKKKI